MAEVTSSCTIGAGLVDAGADDEDTATDEEVDEEVVVGFVVEVVVIVGNTGIVAEVVLVESPDTVVVVSSTFPTVNLNIAVLAKLYESPVHVPPNGLSRPYAYMV
jgi:hypothetical protein